MNIHKEEDDVSLLGGQVNLLADFLLEDIVTVDNPASGIYHRKLMTSPQALAVLAVAGGTCLIAHDGMARLSKAVEKGALAHIGATHDSY